MHRLELTYGNRMRHQDGGERIDVKLKDNGGFRQSVFVAQTRMQFTHKSRFAAVNKDACGAPGVQCRMHELFKGGLKRRNQRLNVALHVKEVDVAGGFAPLQRVRVTVGKACDMVGLAHALHGKVTVFDGFIREEHTAQFKNADVFGLTV